MFPTKTDMNDALVDLNDLNDFTDPDNSLQLADNTIILAGNEHSLESWKTLETLINKLGRIFLCAASLTCQPLA